MRNLKTLGLALVAVLAMFAVVASAASANTKQFHSEASETTITGSQIGTDEFVTNAGTVKCTEATYHGVQSGTTTETVTITPTYTGCTAFGFPATINMNGCDYVFHSERTETTATQPPVTHLIPPKIDIECGAAGPIIITAKSFGTTKCTGTVGQQTGLQGTSNTGINFTNEGSGSTRDIKVTLHLEGLQYTNHAGTGFAACSSESASNGTYKGEATVKGDNVSGGAQVGVWYE